MLEARGEARRQLQGTKVLKAHWVRAADPRGDFLHQLAERSDLPHVSNRLADFHTWALSVCPGAFRARGGDAKRKIEVPFGSW